MLISLCFFAVSLAKDNAITFLFCLSFIDKQTSSFKKSTLDSINPLIANIHIFIMYIMALTRNQLSLPQTLFLSLTILLGKNASFYLVIDPPNKKDSHDGNSWL